MKNNDNKVYYKPIAKGAVNAPVVHIDYKVQMLQDAIVDACSEEVGWLYLVKKNGDDYFIYDLIMCEQEVHATTCELKESALNDVGMELLNSNNAEDFNNVRGWGHSHVNMGVSPSTQDDETFEKYMKDCEDYFIRIIVNKKGDVNCELADYENGYLFTNIIPEVDYPHQLEELYKKLDEIQSEIDELTDEYDRSDEGKALVDKYVRKKIYTYNGNGSIKSTYNNDKWGKYYNNYGYEYGNYGNYVDIDDYRTEISYIKGSSVYVGHIEDALKIWEIRKIADGVGDAEKIKFIKECETRNNITFEDYTDVILAADEFYEVA